MIAPGKCTSQPRVGVIGCGVMGAHYARVIALTDCADLAAVCDLDAGRAEDCASRWQAPEHFSDHHEMLPNCPLDAVVVATPDFAHCEPACDALEAGLAVLCEKPLATSLPDADAMQAASRASARPFMVNFGNRHRPNARKIREIVRSGAIGRVEHVFIRLNERLCKTKTIPWLERTSPVWFLLSHCVDLVRWLLEDEFSTVHARAVEGAVARICPGVPDARSRASARGCPMS